MSVRDLTALYRLSAPNHPSSSRVCRDAIGALLHAQGHSSLIDTVKLLVSEAVTNVHRHALATHVIHIDVLVQNGTALVVVKDNDPREHPFRRPAEPEDEGGRGLLLMDQLAFAWGVSWSGGPDPTGKQVWFEVRAPEKDA
ncbi:ATP-binding protein [Streptomyces palmae]|uniref:ATP-binding protein n=1 Tax=Streptomyces palmae TaxID=1701085 RepID=A0A4Z0GZC4_9ACTN|nr:ATP-binding protein [Streptomyces palmae]TGB02593.1 ATP-binding protein [Streptomyces palmae]